MLVLRTTTDSCSIPPICFLILPGRVRRAGIGNKISISDHLTQLSLDNCSLTVLLERESDFSEHFRYYGKVLNIHVYIYIYVCVFAFNLVEQQIHLKNTMLSLIVGSFCILFCNRNDNTYMCRRRFHHGCFVCFAWVFLRGGVCFFEGFFSSSLFWSNIK